MKTKKRERNIITTRLHERKRRQILAGLSVVLSMAMVLGVVLNLMQPANTMTTICGLEEHTHSSACYTQVLSCAHEGEEGHEHSADCYKSVLSCGKSEHTHTDSCYPKPEPVAVEAAPKAEAPQNEEVKSVEAPEQESAPEQTPAQETVEVKAEAEQSAPAAADEAPEAEPAEQPAEPVSEPAETPSEEPVETPSEEPEQPEEPAVEPVEPAAILPVKVESVLANPATVFPNEEATFTFVAANAEKLNYALTKGGETIASGELSVEETSYTYTPDKTGDYTFTLTAIGADGADAAASATLHVVPAEGLSVKAQADQRSVLGGQEASFTLVSESAREEGVTCKIVIRQGDTVIYESDEYHDHVSVTTKANKEVTKVTLNVTLKDAAGRTAEAEATISCGVDKVETQAQWEKTMKGVKHTGVWAEDLLAIAESQLGYQESAENFYIDEDGKVQGWTRYGEKYGMPYVEWCAMFVSFCLDYAEVPESGMPRTSNCQNWIDMLQYRGLYVAAADAKDELAPKKGDLIFLDWKDKETGKRDGHADHIGIYLYTDENGTIHTLEGNHNKSVCYVSYEGEKLESVMGYGLLNRAYAEYMGLPEDAEEEAPVEVEEEAPAQTELKYAATDYTVTLNYDAAAEIPEGAELTVLMPEKDGEGYQAMTAAVEAALAEAGEEAQARKVFFTPQITKDDEIVTPAAPVTVTVAFADALALEEGTQVRGFRFTADGAAALEMAADQTEDGAVAALSFTADELSMFGLVEVKAQEAEAEAPVEYENALSAKGADYAIRVAYTDAAEIPDNARIIAREILPGTEEYAALTAQTEASLQDGWAKPGEFARYFDITITADGEKVEPKAPVSVTITFDNPVEVDASANMKAVHFAEESVEVIDAAAAQTEATLEAVQFEANGFSVYGVVDTYAIESKVMTADGETYEIEITYGPEAEIPTDAELKAREITPEDEKYTEYYAAAEASVQAETQEMNAEAGNETTDVGGETTPMEPTSVEAEEGEPMQTASERSMVTLARFFENEIVDANGEPVNPQAPVKVEIRFVEAEDLGETTALQGLQFAGEEAPVELNAEYKYADNTLEGVEFTTSEITVAGVVGTHTLRTHVIDAKGDTYLITVTYDDDAGVPAEATLLAEEVLPEDDNYLSYYTDASAAAVEDEIAAKVTSARLFNIAIMNGEEKIVPKTPVKVEITFLDTMTMAATAAVKTVHFPEEADLEILEAATMVSEVPVEEKEPVLRSLSMKKSETEIEDEASEPSLVTKLDSVSFITGSFSIYAVVIIDKEADTLVFEDENYRITVSYTEEANIPLGTELTVREIIDEAEYDALWAETIEKLNEGVTWENQDEADPRKGLSDAVFFDITLVAPDGTPFEPEVPLGVKIEFLNHGVSCPANEEAFVIHFAEEGTELIDDVRVATVDLDPSKLPDFMQGGSEVELYEYQQLGFSTVGAATTGEYIEISIIDYGAGALRAPVLRAASDIAASKTVTDPDGDGVFELALSVTGSSESSTSTNVDKSNVVIVVDVSGSMTQNYTYSPYTYSADTYSSNTTYYSDTSGGGTVWHWPGGNYGYGWNSRYYAEGWYRGTYGNFNTPYNGTVYTRQTRLEATKGALKQLVNALLANNKPEGTIAEDGITRLDDIIEITLIKFAFAQQTNNYNGTSTLIRNVNTSTEHAQLDTIIDDLWAGGGTNWERALAQANTEATSYKNAQPNETTSVIFLTDGVPTSWGTTNTNGQETADNTHEGWNRARDDARTIVTNGFTLYNIFSYGTDTQKYDYDGGRTDADYLRSLTNYAYTGTGTYANTSSSTQYVRDYFFNARDTQALTDAFQKIIDNISNTVGYGGVDYEDGVTVGVTNTSVTVGGSVKEDAFRYTVRNGNTIVYTVKISGNSATFTINGVEYTDSTPETVTTVIDPDDHSKDITSTVYSVEVDGKEYKMSPAAMNQGTGLVDWDLAGLGILENGYTYTVAFDVWPNQDSYDMVADLNNGVKTLDNIRAELIAELGEEAGTARYNQIAAALQGPDASGQYSILTNWKQEVNYYTVETVEDDQGNSSTSYTPQEPKVLPNPSPIALTSKPLPMWKVWNSSLSPDQIGNLLYNDYPTNSDPTGYRVTLHLWRADTATALQSMIDDYASSPATASANDYIEKTLGWNGTAYDWEESVAIAPGTMVSLRTAEDMGITLLDSNKVTYGEEVYYIIEKGHYYFVTEDNIDWHFELQSNVYHPMMVNGRLKNVTFITDAQGNITGVEDIEDMTQVTATNSKTAELDITKWIDDRTGKMTDNQKDAETFTYKIFLRVPVDADMSHTNLLEWVPRLNDDVSASNRYYIYGYQTSEQGELLGFANDVERFNQKVYGQYTVSWLGGNATLDEIFTTDAGGETKSGTIYATLKQKEVLRLTNLPSGTYYEITEMYNNLYQADPSRDADANLTSPPASNIAAAGYEVSIATKNGAPSVNRATVSGTITELNKRYYNQFTNKLSNTAVVDFDVTKHLQGYEWTGDRYYVKLAAEDENTPLPRITTRYLSADSGTDDVTFNFGSVHLKPGTYTYTITEMNSDYNAIYSGTVVNGVTYDNVKTIKVSVADDLTVSIANGSSDGVTYDAESNTVKTKVTNKVVKVSIYKIGGADVTNELAGVKFKLYSDEQCTNQVLVDARNNPIGENGVLTTDENGTRDIGILNTGTYYLVETDTVPGYNLLSEKVKIIVANNGSVTYVQNSYNASQSGEGLLKVYSNGTDEVTVDSATGTADPYASNPEYTFVGYRITVNNSSGYSLPNTGSVGDTLYTLAGLSLLSMVVLAAIGQKRRPSRGRRARAYR